MQLYYEPADAAASPPFGDVLPFDVVIANNVVRVGVNALIAAFNLQAIPLVIGPGAVPTGPAPTRDYLVQVIHGDRLRNATNMVAVTENAFAFWGLGTGPERTVGQNLFVRVLAFDATGNKVTVPGGAQPAVIKSAGTATVGEIVIGGRYSHYVGQVPLTGAGTLKLKVTGRGRKRSRLS